MQDREFPIFGRKVFFVNPPLGFDVSVIKKLREEEYEVYTIADYKYVKSILRKNENALCFINIDNGLKVNEWYNFIKSFKLEDDLKSIFIGVMSGYAGTGERGKFLINLQLPGGFINTHIDSEKLYEQIEGILRINGAKGRRQYLRLRCNDIPGVNGYIVVGNNLFSMDIENISSVGFACSYNQKEVASFEKNSVHNEISLTILRKSIICPSVVYDTKIVDGRGFSVMLFKKDVPKSARNVIKSFIFSVLEEEFVNAARLAMPDYTDYSVEIKIDNLTEYELPPEEPLKKIGDVAIPKPDDAADVEDIEEVEEVEEIDEVDGAAENAETGESAESTETSPDEANAPKESQGLDDVSDIEQI